MNEVTLRGTVPEVDQYWMTFHLQDVHGNMIPAPMPEQYRDVIIAAFKGYRDNARLLIQCTGHHDRNNRLCEIEVIEQVTPLGPQDVPAQLDEIRNMKDGWLDGTGKAPSHQGLDWFATAFSRHYPADAKIPRLYPTPAGGIRLEWDFGRLDASISVDLADRTAVWHKLDLSDPSDDGQEMELDLDHAEGWEWFIQEVCDLG